MYLSVCVRLLVMFTNPTKTDEPIEMLFGELTRVSLRNHVPDGVEIPTERGNCGGCLAH